MKVVVNVSLTASERAELEAWTTMFAADLAYVSVDDSAVIVQGVDGTHRQANRAGRPLREALDQAFLESSSN